MKIDLDINTERVVLIFELIFCINIYLFKSETLDMGGITAYSMLIGIPLFFICLVMVFCRVLIEVSFSLRMRKPAHILTIVPDTTLFSLCWLFFTLADESFA